MNTFNLVYIDDNIDNYLSSFLDNYQCKDEENQIQYAEKPFDTGSDYDSILNDPKIRTANIIVIDDRLFEDRTVEKGKFTGEEFKIVLKKYFPFIETVVITQNQADEQVGTISKYKPENLDQTPEEFYQENLAEAIEAAIGSVMRYRRLNAKLHNNSNWEIVIQEKILNSIEGKGAFDELTKSDIDTIIDLFREMQGQFQDGN